MRIGIPQETAAGEKRVATVPDVVAKLIKLGFTVAVQSGAGAAANFADDTYVAAGAEVVTHAQTANDFAYLATTPASAALKAPNAPSCVSRISSRSKSPSASRGRPRPRGRSGPRPHGS